MQTQAGLAFRHFLLGGDFANRSAAAGGRHDAALTPDAPRRRRGALRLLFFELARDDLKAGLRGVGQQHQRVRHAREPILKAIENAETVEHAPEAPALKHHHDGHGGDCICHHQNLSSSDRTPFCGFRTSVMRTP